MLPRHSARAIYSRLTDSLNREIGYYRRRRKDDVRMKKNIVILYDERSTHTSTVREHLHSFKDFSRHNIFYAPATNLYWPYGSGFTDEFSTQHPTNRKWSFEPFDVVVVHYSVRLSFKGYIAPHIVESLRGFCGRKVLFIQDEYENVETTRSYIDELGIDAVFTCVPKDGLEYVYEAESKRSHIEFLPTLTGYVPYLTDLEPFRRPMSERSIVVAYRGRKLPHHYGLLGYDKYIIGERFREETVKRAIKADVETDDNKRIYGSWYEFLGSARATLGTESGCNIFDFDGALKERAQQLSGEAFLQVYGETFAEHEGLVKMNQISPKFFEAIMLGTALVCFPGTYSGILLKNEHFIQIERDFSNMDEVLDKLHDVKFLEGLTERAYIDIIAPQKYSYRTFVRSFDDWLDERVPTSKSEIVSTPIGSMTNGVFTAFGFQSPTDMLFNTTLIAEGIEREAFCTRYEPSNEEAAAWNCARVKHGAKIIKSSPFFPHPHDAESLLLARIKGNYAAGLEGSAKHFIEIDLGSVRPVCGIVLDWLGPDNLGETFAVKGSRNGLIWKTLLTSPRNEKPDVRAHFETCHLRYIRLDVFKFRGQQRILMKNFEVLAD